MVTVLLPSEPGSCQRPWSENDQKDRTDSRERIQQLGYMDVYIDSVTLVSSGLKKKKSLPDFLFSCVSLGGKEMLWNFLCSLSRKIILFVLTTIWTTHDVV